MHEGLGVRWSGPRLVTNVAPGFGDHNRSQGRPPRPKRARRFPRGGLFRRGAAYFPYYGHPVPRLAALISGLLLLALVLGCDSAPSAATPASPSGPGGSPRPQAKGPDVLVEATWAEQCAACHGPIGHGDGPTGPMVHATDLTRADWQATMTDEQLARSIVTGKGKMPSFVDLPEKVVRGLVARIRASKGH